MRFDTFLSGADLVAHLFDGGEEGLKVQELPFTWCEGLLFADLAAVAGSVAYKMDCDRAYEKKDVGWRAGKNREEGTFASTGAPHIPIEWMKEKCS